MSPTEAGAELSMLRYLAIGASAMLLICSVVRLIEAPIHFGILAILLTMSVDTIAALARQKASKRNLLIPGFLGAIATLTGLLDASYEQITTVAMGCGAALALASGALLKLQTEPAATP
jgi:hypothetical protein